MQRVVQVDEAEQGLQHVVAVRPASDDMQKKVEFGWCGTGQFHLGIFLAEIN
jgi:hypothetical protein